MLNKTLSPFLFTSFPTLLYCSLNTFSGLLKKYFQTPRLGLPVTCALSYRSLKTFYSKPYDVYLSAHGKLAHKIILDPSHPLHNYLSKCNFHSSVCLTVCSIPTCLNVYRIQTVLYLARIFIKREKVVADLLRSILSTVF